MDTAVILAAREEKEFDIPVPLIKCLDGSTLLDRSVAILKEVGINKIIVVTGYRSDLFSSIYDNLIIVYNEKYRDTSSMASLSLVAPYVSDDFLLIESDVLYERTFLDRLIQSSSKNCFSIIQESGSGDEAFVELEEGFVKHISKDIHQLCHVDGEMVGLSKISIQTFHQMLKKWKDCDNDLMNYEYLLLDCVQLHELTAIKSLDLICYEVDTDKDLLYLKETVYPILCRKENPFDRRNVLSFYQDIMSDTVFEDKDILIDQIGGMTNRNFKITHAGNSYVLRVPGNGTEGMVVRKNEDYNTRLASQIGITPELLYLNIDSGIKLTKYIDGAETLNGATIQRLSNLKQVIENVHKLHYSGVRLNNDFNVFKEILVYEELLEKAKGTMYEGYEIIRPKVFALADTLNTLGVTLAPCHNDLVAENFVKRSDGKIFLIDWEYSGMNDPLWDLAALFIECDFTKENRERALKLYFGEEAIPSSIYTKLTIYQVLMDVLWAIWTRLKEAQGDDFGSYGMMRFQRAMEGLNQLATL